MDNNANLSSAGIGEFSLIPLTSITVKSRLRTLRPEFVETLTDNIAQNGLHTPISVVAVEGDDGTLSYELVAGNHRLEAFKQLQRETIPARVLRKGAVERELWEIDENLYRAELTKLERGEHLLKRKELYEQLHPETRQYIAGAEAANASMGRGDATAKSAVASFGADTAAKTRIPERTIRHEIARVRKIDHTVRDRIRENPKIADNGTELEALGKLQPEDQLRAIDLVLADKVKSVKAARRVIQNLPRPVATPYRPKGAQFKVNWHDDDRRPSEDTATNDDEPAWELYARELIKRLVTAVSSLSDIPDEERIIDLLRSCSLDDLIPQLTDRKKYLTAESELPIRAQATTCSVAVHDETSVGTAGSLLPRGSVGLTTPTNDPRHPVDDAVTENAGDWPEDLASERERTCSEAVLDLKKAVVEDAFEKVNVGVQ